MRDPSSGNVTDILLKSVDDAIASPTDKNLSKMIDAIWAHDRAYPESFVRIHTRSLHRIAINAQKFKTPSRRSEELEHVKDRAIRVPLTVSVAEQQRTQSAT